MEIIEKYQPAVDTDGKANYWSRKKSFQSAVFYIYSNNEKYFFYYYGELYNDLYSCYIENEHKKNATNLEIEKLLDHYMPFRSEQYTLYVPEIFSFEVTNCRTNKTTIVENDIYIDESIGLKRLQAEPIIEWYIGGSGMTDYNKPTTPLKDDEVVYKIRCSTSINEYLIKIGESKIQINDFTYKYKKSNFYGTQFPDSLVELVQKDIYYWFN